MLSDWEPVLLEDVADELTVGFVGTMASEYVDAGIPFLRSLNVMPLEINNNDLKFISPEFHQKIIKSRLTPGDVVIVRTGKPGACAVVPDWLQEANCSDLVIVRCGERINNRFLAYYINTETSGHVAAHLVGAVQQHFNVGSARKFLINLPPIEDQRAITAVLGTLDDKIELNRKMNATLEAMARALFKSWFVDFDPVRAKMEGKQPFGMDAEAAALFPSRLTPSALGDIPEGWGVTPLNQIAKFLNGLALQKYPPTGDNFLPVIKISQIRQGSATGADIASSNIPAEYVLDNGDVIFSWSGSLMQVLWTGGKGALNQHLFKVTSETFPKWFHFMWVEEHMPWFQSIAASKATTMGHIQRQHLEQAKVIIPPKSTLIAMDKIFAPIFAKKLEIGIENTRLEKTRDYLLPKLISGDIRIPDAEKMVGGVA